MAPGKAILQTQLQGERQLYSRAESRSAKEDMLDNAAKNNRGCDKKEGLEKARRIGISPNLGVFDGNTAAAD